MIGEEGRRGRRKEGRGGFASDMYPFLVACIRAWIMGRDEKGCGSTHFDCTQRPSQPRYFSMSTLTTLRSAVEMAAELSAFSKHPVRFFLDHETTLRHLRLLRNVLYWRNGTVERQPVHIRELPLERDFRFGVTYCWDGLHN